MRRRPPAVNRPRAGSARRTLAVPGRPGPWPRRKGGRRGHARTGPGIAPLGGAGTTDGAGCHRLVLRERDRRAARGGFREVDPPHEHSAPRLAGPADHRLHLSLIHISEPTRLGMISYA